MPFRRAREWLRAPRSRASPSPQDAPRGRVTVRDVGSKAGPVPVLPRGGETEDAMPTRQESSSPSLGESLRSLRRQLPCTGRQPGRGRGKGTSLAPGKGPRPGTTKCNPIRSGRRRAAWGHHPTPRERPQACPTRAPLGLETTMIEEGHPAAKLHAPVGRRRAAHARPVAVLPSRPLLPPDGDLLT